MTHVSAERKPSSRLGPALPRGLLFSSFGQDPELPESRERGGTGGNGGPEVRTSSVRPVSQQSARTVPV